MKTRALFAVALLLLLGAAAQAQVPLAITSISPTQTTAGAASFTLTVTGTGFVTDGVSRVDWGGTLLPYSAPIQNVIRVTVDRSLFLTPGTVQVRVANFEETFSNPAPFTVNPPPVISPAAPARATPNVPYSHQFVVTGGTAPVTWSFSGALPPGLLLNNAGLLSGTPTREGSSTFTLGVRDSVGVSAEPVSFTVVVGPPPLTISTSSSLPNGAVGVAYSQTLAAQGGVPPYNWNIVEGTLPSGLTLRAAGVISGTPAVTGNSTIRIAVTDSTGQVVFKAFFLTVNPAPLTITTASPLPGATVGAAYSQTFAAAGGTPPYVTWSLISGSLPLGMSFSPGGALLSGTPTQTGLFAFTIAVTDSARITATKPFSLTVSPPAPVITTASPLPNATAGQLYSLSFAATGGATAYTWFVPPSGLPTGMDLSPAGLLSGTPTTAGTYTFTVTVNGLTSKQFAITVVLPPAPAVSVTSPANNVNPLDQPSFDVQLDRPYALTITGTLELLFAPDAVVQPPGNPQVQFSTGGQILAFTIPVGQSQPSWPASHQIQTGTVAGTITVRLKDLTAGGQSILPTPAPTRSVQIARSVPRIVSVQIANRTSTGFDLRVTGYSTPRQVTQAVFSFTATSGANLQTTQLTVPVDTAFTTWYGGASSTQFGSSFQYTQPFTVQGNTTAIASVSVTLVNSTGSSLAVSASF